MAKIPFKVSARAGKLLGRENFSNPEGAIIELVKNSYDADAHECFVIFDIKSKIVDKKTVFDNENSSIFIIDNGEGMRETVIKDQWMKIGTGNKEFNAISDGKRVKTGAKGIGRFALDRLGTKSEMWTLSKKPETPRVGHYWEMDWKQFDNSDKPISSITADLIDIEINLNEILSTELPENVVKKTVKVKFERGTVLRISNLKDDWYDNDVENVFKSLEALIPPKELKIPFQVFFYHCQQINEFGKVDTAFFNEYDYKIVAQYNADKLNVDFTITRDELDIGIVKKKYKSLYKSKKVPFDLKTLEKKTFSYTKSLDKLLKWQLTDENKKTLKEVGSFNLSFYYLKYAVSKKESYPYKSINTKERRSILDKFGGVKIYRDSFRVRPYGDVGNDWLGLGSRRAKSPAGAGQRIGDWRVSPESTAGIITISRETNPLLRDKSDRGALQENEAFETFKKIIVGVIHEFELDRTKILNPYYLWKKAEDERILEEKIQSRAEALAEKIVNERKKSDEKYGKNEDGKSSSSSNKKREEEEKKAYEDAAKETIRGIEDEIFNQNREEIVQVRALASLGLIFSSFAHELKEVRNNTGEIKELEKLFKKIAPTSLKKSVTYTDGVDIIDLLKEDSEKIKYWVNYSLTAIRKDKRKRKKLNFSSFLISLTKTWKRVFVERNIEFTVIDKLDGLDYHFRGFEMDFNTIFANLINNSIDAFNQLKTVKDRKINISIEKKDESIEIFYSDNGVGLSDVFDEKEEIYEPFTTSKKDDKGVEFGTGLGMYLVKNVIDDNNGKIEILEPKVGFSVHMSFPLRKQ